MKAETRPPEAPKSETKPPPLIEEPEPETGEEEERPKSDPLNQAGAISPVEEKPKEERRKFLRSRPSPKPPPTPPPQPQIEPMVGKYFGPGDLLRGASHAFEPLKLLMVLPAVAVLGVVCSLLLNFAEEASGSTRGWALAILAWAIGIFGLGWILTALAYVTRRQLEGKTYSMSDVVRYARSNVVTAALYPICSLAPSLVAVGLLYIFRWIRNAGSGGASFVKIVYILPMAFAFLAMAGVFVFQLASMYITAAGAVEGQGLSGAVTAAWNHVRRQWGRVVLHWLIITVAVGVISCVSLGLAWRAFLLPQFVFGPAEGRVGDAWNNFGALFTLYIGLALGIGLTLPVSLLSTLGTLSYLSLRHPAGASLWPAPPEETSGELESVRSTTSHPGEATQPGETRPAPADEAGGSDVSDDSDEQPLVKAE